MSKNIIDAELCARMFLAGAANLESKKEWINELNVFPVPDGDTGTNMTMTIMSAANEVSAVEDVTMKAVAKAMSSGSLRGARGNSGVILSQLLRGFCKVVRDQDQIDAQLVAAAFQKATETAYKAVMKPKEGTILTVARAVSDKAAELVEQNAEIGMQELIEGSVAYGEEVLAKTPDMLPVLKEAGVVDSGGQGLIEILAGARDCFLGKEVVRAVPAEEKVEEKSRYAYSTAFTLLKNKGFEEDTTKGLIAYFETIADQISVEEKADRVEVSMFTNDPGHAMNRALRFGALIDIAIENQDAELLQKAAREEAEANAPAEAAPEMPHKEVGFVTVAIGDGISQIFRDLGADHLIEGGQTMNPSTDDVIKAIEAVNADTVFVFPNNKNIILAANQAQQLVTDRKVIVIPTKTIPQGITALINYVPENTPEENEAAMNEEISLVRTGQLTYAVRDTRIDDKEIHQGDIMGVGDSGILAVGKDLKETAIETVAEMMDEDSELISVYYGSDTSEEDAQALCDELSEKYPDCDVELNAGGQPIYYYIISVE